MKKRGILEVSHIHLLYCVTEENVRMEYSITIAVILIRFHS